MKSLELYIDNRKIGPNSPVFLVAELSANHRQDLDLALKTIQAAAASGADAVKLQTYRPDTITLDSHDDPFLIRQNTIWDGMYLYDLYEQAYTPWEWHPRLFQEAADLGLICFSSVFDAGSVDFLQSLNNPAYKIASFEINDLPLIEYAASKGKPIILSTGIARLGEIADAIDCCHAAGNPQIALLKCVSSYPTAMENVNLKTMNNMQETFGHPAGLSDHTLGGAVAIAAVALGACMIEKHFILDRSLGGPDAVFSMEPAEFAAMARGIRDVEKAVGEVTYELNQKQMDSRAHARSLFAVADIAEGEPFSVQNVRSIRPACGLPPRHLPEILKKRARYAIKKGTPLCWGHIDRK